MRQHATQPLPKTHNVETSEEGRKQVGNELNRRTMNSSSSSNPADSMAVIFTPSFTTGYRSSAAADAKNVLFLFFVVEFNFYFNEHICTDRSTWRGRFEQMVPLKWWQ